MHLKCFIFFKGLDQKKKNFNFESEKVIKYIVSIDQF